MILVQIVRHEYSHLRPCKTPIFKPTIHVQLPSIKSVVKDLGTQMSRTLKVELLR